MEVRRIGMVDVRPTGRCIPMLRLGHRGASEGRGIEKGCAPISGFCQVFIKIKIKFSKKIFLNFFFFFSILTYAILICQIFDYYKIPHIRRIFYIYRNMRSIRGRVRGNGLRITLLHIYFEQLLILHTQMVAQ
jgi:hypothetical protein